MTWQGRRAVKKPGFKEKKRSAKDEAAFQETLKQDRRRFAISTRYQLVRDAVFLIIQATHRLQDSWRYYDCSQNPDFDDLNHNVHYAESFIGFALEQLEEIADRDWELDCTPEQLGAKVDALLKQEKANGRRARDNAGKGKKRSKRGQEQKRKN